MEVAKDGRQRKTKVNPKCKNSVSDDFPRSLGNVASAGSKVGSQQIRIGGENSQESDSARSLFVSAGGILTQLIQRTKSQLGEAEQWINTYKTQKERLQQELVELEQLQEEMNRHTTDEGDQGEG